MSFWFMLLFALVNNEVKKKKKKELECGLLDYEPTRVLGFFVFFLSILYGLFIIIL